MAKEEIARDPDACSIAPTGAYPGRYGYGPRLPLLVMSPGAKTKIVDHTMTDRRSIVWPSAMAIVSQRKPERAARTEKM